MPSSLTIVCVSYNSPPQNDAEAICTARLLSAIAEAGHEVHWITAAHARTLDESVENEIVNPKIRISRIPDRESGPSGRLGLELKYQAHVPYIGWIEPAVAAARQKLREHSGAVLLTRSMPVVSNIVGYYCRRIAAVWVAHFSDPYPFSFSTHKGIATTAAMFFHSRWARRIISNADLITVTCANAIRFMEERLGMNFRDRVQIVTHLAVPKLIRGDTVLQRESGEFWLAHFGALMRHRNPDELLAGLERAAQRIPTLKFLQLGHIDTGVSTQHRFGTTLRLENDKNLSPRAASDLREQVDVNVIVDADIGSDYSPFIASKYPHSVCSGRPLLMLSHPDSAMNYYTREHGGGVFASYRSSEDIEHAILKLHHEWKSGMAAGAPSPALMKQFSAETIVPPLMARLAGMLRDSSEGRKCFV